MTDRLQHIVERFPYASHTIKSLALRDPDFRSSCEDYGKCVEAISYWNHGSDHTSRVRVDEYRDLCQRIEAEILEALKS